MRCTELRRQSKGLGAVQLAEADVCDLDALGNLLLCGLMQPLQCPENANLGNMYYDSQTNGGRSKFQADT